MGFDLEKLQSKKSETEKLIKELEEKLSDRKEVFEKILRKEDKLYESMRATRDALELSRIEILLQKISEKKRKVKGEIEELERKLRGARRELEEINRRIEIIKPKKVRWITEYNTK